ncbi:MAG: STAS domain-containing protein [Vicinamibacterales bacterium]
MAPSSKWLAGKELVLSPQEPLVAGGPAEELEQRIQSIYHDGQTQLAIDLSRVPLLDSAGIRALVRGHTTAQRLGRRFVIVAPNPTVRELFRLARLDTVLDLCDSIETAHTRSLPWARILTAAAVILLGGALFTAEWLGLDPGQRVVEAPPFTEPVAGARDFAPPLFELAKLVSAALIGMLVTAVHRQYRTEPQVNRSMDQAQVLLCIAGAMIMIIIGNSLARAFGIAGAASIIRFRTPVDDARDITVLFLLMALGMAAGLGGFAVAGLGTVFLCAMFPVLELFSAERPRTMLVEVVADGRRFPTSHVQRIFAINRIVFEPRELTQGDEAAVRYLTTLGPTDSLEDLSAQLMGDGKMGIKNVSWSPPKRPS